jgi:hypothetical protein
MRIRSGSLAAVALAMVALAAATALRAQAGAGGPPKTQITVWAAPPPASDGIYGGLAYGGYAPTTGAMVTEQREVEVAGGEARIAGVAATIDPASVQLRDLTDRETLVTEQHFVTGAATPTEILARHLGDPVTVVTPKAEVTGTLRSVDEQVIVIEVGTGDARRLQMMRRDGYVQDVRLPVGTGSDKPSLVWRVRSAKPGKHTVELSYRADGMSWTADYLAVLDEARKAIDFSARATIKNATGASFDSAELTLVSGGTPGVLSGGLLRPAPPPVAFAVPAQIRIGHGEAVQVELIPPRLAAKARSVITYEAMTDPSPSFQAYPGTDCNQFSGAGEANGRAEVAVELDMPAQTMLPDGKVRLFHRRAGKLELVTEDPLRASPGLARIRIAPASDVTGQRRSATCTYDEHGHTIHEAVEVSLENKAKQAVDVIVREFLWRWPVWHLEAEAHKGARVGPQIQEYRVHVPATGKQVVTYTAVYTW